jgi:uncharacterized surface protein with fasciclin (FAS1) repeats
LNFSTLLFRLKDWKKIPSRILNLPCFIDSAMRGYFRGRLTAIKYQGECNIMKLQIKSVFAALCVMTLVGSVGLAETSVQVGGAAMYPSKDIIENALNSKDHTTLVAAVKAAGLVETLKSKGPFTVFAPTNAAFAKLPPGTVDGLLKPEAKPTLAKILTYHVVSGRLDSKSIAAMIKKGGGKASLKTVQGGTLTAWMDGKALALKDEAGGESRVSIADVFQKNGVIHVVDTVLMPK